MEPAGAAEFKYWSDMTRREQDAASCLRYTPDTWDLDDSVNLVWTSLSAEQRAAAKSLGFEEEDFLKE